MGHPPSQGQYTVQIGVKGRLILPAAVRRALSLEPARQVASGLRGLFA